MTALLAMAALTGAAAANAERLTIRRAVLRGVDFSKKHLRSIDVLDVRFENCNFSNADICEASICRTQFIGCKMVGAAIAQAWIKDTAFSNCTADYINFRFTQFNKVCFKDCRLQTADFQSAKLEKTILTGSDLRKAQMSGVSLAGIDFRSCDIDGIGARPENLRGAIILPEQAQTAAKVIGMIIKDD